MGIGFAEGIITALICVVDSFSELFIADLLVCVALGIDMVRSHNLSSFARF